MTPSKDAEAKMVAGTSDPSDQLASMSLSDSGPGGGSEFCSEAEKDDDKFCSNCGKTGDDLMGCNGCRSIRYCSAACQKKHWKTHKVECKRVQAVLKNGPNVTNQRVDLSETQDDDDSSLFDDPPPRPDCDICMLTLPLDIRLSVYASCCGKTLCGACSAFHFRAFLELNKWNEENEQHLLHATTCPFCRAPFGCAAENLKRLQKRATMNDPLAMYHLSFLNENAAKASEVFVKAAELGHPEALFELGLFLVGNEADRSKAMPHFELAARGGHVLARHRLGYHQFVEKRNVVKAVKHWRISAAAGCAPSANNLIQAYEDGFISHADLSPSLRARDKAQVEMKSERRELLVTCLKARGEYEDNYGTHALFALNLRPETLPTL